MKKLVLLLGISASSLFAMGADLSPPLEVSGEAAYFIVKEPNSEVDDKKTWAHLPHEIKLMILEYTLSDPTEPSYHDGSRTPHLKMYANLCGTSKEMRALSGDKTFLQNGRVVKETLLGTHEKETLAKTYLDFHEKFLNVLGDGFKEGSDSEDLKNTATAFKTFVSDYYFVNPKNFTHENNQHIKDPLIKEIVSDFSGGSSIEIYVDYLAHACEKTLFRTFRPINMILSGKDLEEYQEEGKLRDYSEMEGASMEEQEDRIITEAFLELYKGLDPEKHKDAVNITMDLYVALCSWTKKPYDTFENILKRSSVDQWGGGLVRSDENNDLNFVDLSMLDDIDLLM